MGMRTAVLAAMVVLASAGCAAVQTQPVAQPQIPTIVPPTSFSRIPQMTDRPLPDDCELVIPVELFNQKLGRELPGELKTIIGIPEPSLARTGKIDCYYGVPEKQPIAAAPVIIGLATYADEAAAGTRVAESVAAEREDGATVREVDVGKKKGQFISSKDERLVLGSLGKTTYVARVKLGVLPDDAVAGVLAALAQQSMTPVEGA
ncbi:hypothetical protein IOD16_27435 [Saccharothrix sp. 6-C]|uniref:DUF5642 domain-containing protein n=2 Tax=Pseudonocardiaceae TaxID=2070 RepID=A0A3N1HF04_9PSEU|nr:hypothetical protein IOD16_27435 [Saccharothrix sp. 6-C]ROP41091.1 hypothetical protein EDD40_6515 [Saccharothrix texasensis]